MKYSMTCVLAGAATLALGGSALGVSYAVPAGGWTYSYDGSTAAAGASGFTALDGTWSHDNGSDEWDGSAIGAGRPGGASTLSGGGVNYLRVQDTGDPRDYGLGDPGSNRKLYFGNPAGLSASALDTGATIYFRARTATTGPLDDAHPDGGGGIGPWPAGGDGYPIHDGGKGNFVIRQSSGGALAFSLDDALSGLTMNNLNGAAVSGDVDTGEAGTANTLGLAGGTTVWHDVWITIRAGGAGTHQASIYVDGSLVPTTFDLTAGSGSDFAGSYIAMGAGATPHAGALDIDFFSVKEGAFAPELIPEPSSLVLIALGGIGLLRRRR